MMTNVAEEGTASGLSVAGATLAGKTGTAEIDVEASLNQPWFIVSHPPTIPRSRWRDDRTLHRLLRRRQRARSRRTSWNPPRRVSGLCS